jgi:hypothetical protein
MELITNQESSIEKLTTEQLIINALNYAMSLGVKIERGPVFAINKETKSCWSVPRACNVYGAILLLLKKENSVKEKFEKGWSKPIEEYLKKDSWWIFRLERGFNQRNEITIIFKNDDGETCEKIDEVSKLGKKISNKFA